MNPRNEIKGVRSLGGCRLRAEFADGYIAEVDLQPLFANPRGPLLQPFHDPEFFAKVFLDPEIGVVAWPNGYDICPDVLRYYCEQGRVTPDEEMNAHFMEGSTASAMHDKPKQ